MSLMRKLTLGGALVLCAWGDPARARAEDCSELGIGELGDLLVEHSCFHSTNGPFSSVTATLGPDPVAATPNVDPVHTHYSVTVSPSVVNNVVYTPVRSGTWAIFTDEAVPLEVVPLGGAAQAVRLSHRVSACPALPLVRVYTLTAGQRYVLRLGPLSSGDTVTPLVLEKISDFETLHGRDQDGDGFGGLTETLSTPCVPPPGFVPNVTDCDDSDPAIHPEAGEVCNGSDDDCDGQGDEQACELGGGGCRAAGAEVGEVGDGSAASALLIALTLALLLARRRKLGAGALVAACWLGDVTPAAAAEACEHLAAPITDHSCFHARFGPFRNVTAGVTSDDLDQVHTYYALALPSPRDGGSISYRPARSGRWAFYTQHDVPLAVRDAAGRALPELHVDGVAGCPLLARVRVVELTANASYQVAIGATSASEVGVVIENLDDFVVLYGRDADGDGYGSAGEVLSSACTPPAGWAAGDSDCDDRDAQIHPGASELCGQPDRNCNGIAGDVGAPCQAGLGACAVAGTFACDASGAPPRCQATALAPGAERCDGIDGDCDGAPDLEEPVCGSAEEPRCVADGRGGARCGCERDADCGDASSGRLCLLRGTEQRCVEGCVEGFGRNGCGAGLRCTSADPAAPGVCEPAAEGSEGGGCQLTRSGETAWAAVLLLGLLLRTRRRRSSRS